MKILVSTKETQRTRSNDFSFVPEDELVSFGFECDGETVDGSCGCRRSLSGVNCHTATTTFKVVEVDISEEDYTEILLKSLVDAGWGTEPMLRKIAKSDATLLLAIASSFNVGDVLERRGGRFQSRLTLYGRC